jgi:general secretion pathway protein A
MNSKKLLALDGLKWNPFSPELPSEGLLVTPRIEQFAWRVEQLVQERGFALITGESGTGKSVALRIVAGRLAALRDVSVGVFERPQSETADFYRELGDLFAVKLKPHNRWGGFKALRERWRTHVASSRIRPMLLVDEAQEMSPEVPADEKVLSLFEPHTQVVPRFKAGKPVEFGRKIRLDEIEGGIITSAGPGRRTRRPNGPDPSRES